MFTTKIHDYLKSIQILKKNKSWLLVLLKVFAFLQPSQVYHDD